MKCQKGEVETNKEIMMWEDFNKKVWRVPSRWGSRLRNGNKLHIVKEKRDG